LYFCLLFDRLYNEGRDKINLPDVTLMNTCDVVLVVLKMAGRADHEAQLHCRFEPSHGWSLVDDHYEKQILLLHTKHG